MAVFAYKALDPSAACVRGVLAADSPRQARDVLRGRGLTVQQVAPAAARVGQLPVLTMPACQSVAFPLRQPSLAIRGADSFRDLKTPAKTGAGHDNDEFIAAKPAREIGFANDLFRARGEVLRTRAGFADGLSIGWCPA